MIFLGRLGRTESLQRIQSITVRQASGKKAAGILVEMVTSPDGERIALIGVGVNVSVSEFPDDLADVATSAMREGAVVESLTDLRVLADEIGIALVFHMRASLVDPAASIRSWRRFDGTSGRRFESATGAAIESGVAEGIDDDGALLLRLDSGALLAVTSATSLREIVVR